MGDRPHNLPPKATTPTTTVRPPAKPVAKPAAPKPTPEQIQEKQVQDALQHYQAERHHVDAINQAGQHETDKHAIAANAALTALKHMPDIPDKGMTWADTDPNKPRDFGHKEVDLGGPAKVRNVYNEKTGKIVWADNGKSVTPEQWTHMPDAQREELAKLIPDPKAQAQFREKMDQAAGKSDKNKAQAPMPDGEYRKRAAAEVTRLTAELKDAQDKLDAAEKSGVKADMASASQAVLLVQGHLAIAKYKAEHGEPQPGSTQEKAIADAEAAMKSMAKQGTAEDVLKFQNVLTRKLLILGGVKAEDLPPVHANTKTDAWNLADFQLGRTHDTRQGVTRQDEEKIKEVMDAEWYAGAPENSLVHQVRVNRLLTELEASHPLNQVLITDPPAGAPTSPGAA